MHASTRRPSRRAGSWSGRSSARASRRRMPVPARTNRPSRCRPPPAWASGSTATEPSRGSVVGMCRSIERLREGVESRRPKRSARPPSSTSGRSAASASPRRGIGRRSTAPWRRSRRPRASCWTRWPGRWRERHAGRSGLSATLGRGHACDGPGRRGDPDHVDRGARRRAGGEHRRCPPGGQKLATEPPEHGEPDVRGLIDDAVEAASHTYEYSGPGYLAYIPGGGLYTAALAEFLAQGLNRYVGLWQPSPAIVQLEENVTRWLCDLFGFPAGVAGPADDRRLDGEPRGDGHRPARAARRGLPPTARYYVTDQAHASVTKAATIAGFPPRNVRIVPTDAELRMDPDAPRGARSARTGPPGCVRSSSSPAAGHHEHRRGRPAGRARRRRAGRGAVAPRRRGLRRLLPADRARPRAVPRDRARRLHHARPAQGAVPAVRHRRRCWCATARRYATRTTSGAATSRTCAPDRRAAELQRVLARALARLPRPAGVVAAASCTASTRSATRSTRSSTSPTACTRRSPTIPNIEVPWRPAADRRCRSGCADGDEAASRGFLARINAVEARVPVQHDDPRRATGSGRASCRTARTRPDRRVRGDRARGRRRDRRLRRRARAPRDPRDVRAAGRGRRRRRVRSRRCPPVLVAEDLRAAPRRARSARSPPRVSSLGKYSIVRLRRRTAGCSCTCRRAGASTSRRRRSRRSRAARWCGFGSPSGRRSWSRSSARSARPGGGCWRRATTAP